MVYFVFCAVAQQTEKDKLKGERSTVTQNLRILLMTCGTDNCTEGKAEMPQDAGRCLYRPAEPIGLTRIYNVLVRLKVTKAYVFMDFR